MAGAGSAGGFIGQLRGLDYWVLFRYDISQAGKW